jgi:uncharacterized repeat protein (TIGR01451 family)
MAFCAALFQGAAFAQAPDAGIKYYVVDRSQYFTSNFTYNLEAGQQVVLNICYANAGSGDASGVSYTMSLPAGLPGVAVTSTQAGSTSGTYNSGTGALTITGLPDPLLAGSQLCPSADAYLYYFSRVVVSFMAPSSTFDAVATVATSTVQNPNVLPDSITGHFVVSGGPTLTDLRVLIEGPVMFGPGVPVEYTVGAQNLGPRIAQNVAVSVRLPLGTTGVAVAGGTFDAASGMVSWPNVGTLAVGGQQMFSFSIINPPPTQGVASVFSDNHETDYFNNLLPFNLSSSMAVPGPGSRQLGMLAAALLILGWAALSRRNAKAVAR